MPTYKDEQTIVTNAPISDMTYVFQTLLCVHSVSS